MKFPKGLVPRRLPLNFLSGKGITLASQQSQSLKHAVCSCVHQKEGFSIILVLKNTTGIKVADDVIESVQSILVNQLSFINVDNLPLLNKILHIYIAIPLLPIIVIIL